MQHTWMTYLYGFGTIVLLIGAIIVYHLFTGRGEHASGAAPAVKPPSARAS